jgi:hypothetical protein
MKWFGLLSLALSFGFSQVSMATPECNIDPSFKDSTSVIAVISGTVKGFDPGAVYVTVTNGDKKYTTLVNREGKWALMYPSEATDSQVLCWQGWIRGTREVVGKIAN